MATPIEQANLLRDILARLAEPGGRVMVATYLRATVYDRRHAGMFALRGGRVHVARGRHWDCIDGCAIKFGRMVAA
jgi:hypothetical protein